MSEPSTQSEGACHELLLQLAGRLPDTLLWRLRDWLALGGHASIAAVLPRELLRRRIGLTDEERELLVGSAGAWGASPRLVDAVLPVPAAEHSPQAFAPDPEVDAAALSALGVVRGYRGTSELRQARRGGQRVLLVVGGDGSWALTGMLQRILRAHGDHTPCVEALPQHGNPTAYHRAAVNGSASLWRAAASASAA
ncbi:MAG: hypothetical protein H0X35_05115 [Pseudonocardiales bacterium]|nr:hypothetical protein [Pseudonocardiales bacterium]